MGKTLLLLRHGKSDWSNAKDTDYARPLARRGVQAAALMGQYLADEDLAPEIIVSSPARRALQTSELLQVELGDVDIIENEHVYEADLDTLVDVVKGLPDDVTTVLLVGHNPGMEELCDELTARSDSVFKTCTLGILESDAESWSETGAGSFSIEGLVNPADVES